MKLHKALAAAAISAACVIPLSAMTAGAADSTSLTVIDGYQYSSEALMAHTICVDDVLVQSGENVINPAIETTPGMHTVTIAGGDLGDCDAAGIWTSGEVDLLDVEAQTLVIGWPDWVDQTRVLNTTLFVDDLSCTEPDTGRVVFRNVNTGGVTASFGTDDGDSLVPLIANVEAGLEDSATVPGGDFPADPASVAAGWAVGETWTFPSEFEVISDTEGTLTYVYAIGGNDGEVGLFADQQDVSVCEVPVTTTAPTTAPTTTMPAKTDAAVAVPVQTQPTYTG